MYGERSSERVKVRVLLHIRQTPPNHRRRTTGWAYVLQLACMGVTCMQTYGMHGYFGPGFTSIFHTIYTVHMHGYPHSLKKV